MEVLIIYPGPTYGLKYKWERYLTELSKWSSGVVIGTSPDPKIPPLGNYRVETVYSVGGRGLLISLKQLVKVVRIAWSQRFDVVVTYDPLRSGLLGRVAATIARCSLVVEVNGVYDSPEIFSGKGGIRVRIRHWLYKKVIRFVLRGASGIKLLFAEQVQALRPRKTAQIVRHFASFVPIEQFSNLGDSKEILCVGSHYHLKGMDILVEAFCSVAPRYPDWRLVLMGWLPDLPDMRDVLARYPQIEIRKAVLADQMPEHIGRCGIFVLPSRTEAMGRVLVEAMAAGKARVGSNVEGIPTVINHESDGLLFETEDVNGLARCLERLMADEPFRRTLGENARARALAEFSADQFFLRTRRLYTDVIAQAAKRS